VVQAPPSTSQLSNARRFPFQRLLTGSPLTVPWLQDSKAVAFSTAQAQPRHSPSRVGPVVPTHIGTYSPGGRPPKLMVLGGRKMRRCYVNCHSQVSRALTCWVASRGAFSATSKYGTAKPMWGPTPPTHSPPSVCMWTAGSFKEHHSVSISSGTGKLGEVSAQTQEIVLVCIARQIKKEKAW